MKSLIVSADDYGQHGAINQGILTLVEHGRVSSFSCLTCSRGWPEVARLITKEVRAKADIGLHLDFTEEAQPVRYPLAVVIGKALAGKLSISQIRETINIQLNQFEDALGIPPDYVDGHQHVHQLPQIRNELIDILLGRYSSKPWIRISDPVSTGLKSNIIRSLGARQMAYLASSTGFMHSGKLLGVYNFKASPAKYFSNMERWLASVRNDDEAIDGPVALMCHPSVEPNCLETLKDPIRKARAVEFEALSSLAFIKLLEKYDIQIVRGKSFLYKEAPV